MQRRGGANNKQPAKALSYLPPPITTLLLLLSLTPSTANEFQPYTINGGLVSAVAGRDFVVVASDTRLSNGYEILTRNHLQSRLWVASNGDDRCLNPHLSSNDGSVLVPTTDDGSSRTAPLALPPTFVASAGCASDCEALKRQVRSEVDAHVHWNYGGRTLGPTGVANLLGQTLYARRGFPFYSFCVVAGVDDGGGVVHVYDAIGSHERVAVACAGTGKEMLQPVLDRMFASVNAMRPGTVDALGERDWSLEHGGENWSPKLVRDGRAVHATEQRIGLKLMPPVETCVECTAEEVVAVLLRGYRSVAEREIAIGDDVVLCVVRTNQRGTTSEKGRDQKDGPPTMEVFRYPLKKH